jgi:cytochrome oxidase assembly protein ShyY1
VEPVGADIEGLISDLEQATDSGRPARAVPGAGGHTTYRRLDARGMAALLPYPVRPFYVRQLPAPGQPDLPRRWDAPAPDEGPHLSYAIQWGLFALCCLLGAGFVALRPPGAAAPPQA